MNIFHNLIIAHLLLTNILTPLIQPSFPIRALTMSCCFSPPVLCAHNSLLLKSLFFPFPPCLILTAQGPAQFFFHEAFLATWVHVSICLTVLLFMPIDVWVCGLPDIPETLSGDPWGHNHFYNNTKMLFVFLIVLTSTMMGQEQWWVKLPMP